MDGLVICLPSHLSPCFSLKSRVLRNGEALCLRSGKLVGLQVLRKSWLLYGKNSLAIGSLHESAASFGEPRSEDDSEEPRIPENEVEVSVSGLSPSGRIVNSEESAQSELPVQPYASPSREYLQRLRRSAQFKEISNDSVKPCSEGPIEDLRVYDSVARAPSWTVTVLTFVVAFSAGVAVAQFRIDLLSRKKHDGGVPPSGMASVSYQEQLLGHFRAEEAPESELKPVLADGSVMLRTAAANAFLSMQDAARKDGIWLIPLSGFRSVTSQQSVFFDGKAERMQRAAERAMLSAPPGYSEHHTGYAIDIGDATDPATYFEPEFDEGAAYRWLEQNGARFHFELSFSKDNLHGVLYEPWHWRFVGDDHSLHTFYAQHKLYNISDCNP
ncbi:uncharacterized protein [Physcomitrium patens]|uniref:uncharacterized protein isoform X2 n=1 Tax=Physcomitrium patens TaxID=3218 RepID=UPI00024AC7BE|nr:uncharacterized protein LOC112282588 isoform X2 [Physcomitrium patens]|eukprot:XP_024376143.1 uncharacterized protein LOC112282588 isoform X2 [Physcomitrella patens]